VLSRTGMKAKLAERFRALLNIAMSASRRCGARCCNWTGWRLERAAWLAAGATFDITAK